MAEYQAGSAYVPVLPDFRNFHKKVGAEFAALEPQAAKAGEKSGAAYGKAFADRARLSDAKIRVSADTTAANAKIREASRDRKVKLKLDAQWLANPWMLGALGGIALGPQAIGLGLAGAGIGAAFGAAAVGAVSFGALAKTEITKVTTAQNALTAAQKAYASATTSAARAKALKAEAAATAGLSSSEKQLGAQVLGVESAWKQLGKAQAPLIARSLLPWSQTALEGLKFLPLLAKPAANAIGLLGNEARVALQSPFWSRFAKTFGTSGGLAIQGFGEAAGHVADGLAHLFTTFAPDIDKLPPEIDKLAGGFDRWGKSVTRSGVDGFLKKTFSHGNAQLLKSDLSALGGALGHIAGAVDQLSPAAFLGLSKVLTILSKLTPAQITALGALYGVSKLTGGLPGTLLAKGATAAGTAILGSAIGTAITSGLKTGLGKVLSGIGLKGLGAKISGAGDVAAVEGAGTEVTGAVEASSGEIIGAITGLGLDIDAAITALGIDIDGAIGAGTTAIVGAIGVSKGIDLIGKGIGAIFGKIAAPHIPSPTVTVKVKVPAVSFKSMAASFRRDVEGPVGAWFAGLAGQAAKAGAAAGRALASGIGSQKKQASGAGSTILNVVKNAFDPLALLGTGEKLIGGLVGGIESRFGDVESVLHKLTGLIPSWKGPALVDATLLTPAGKLIMQSLVKGLDLGWNTVRGTLQAIAPKIASELASAVKQADAQAAKGGGFSGLLAGFVQSGIAQLSHLAYQFNQVEAKIAAARQFAATTAGNVTSTFGIVAAGAPNAAGKTTIGSIQGNLTSYLHKIRAFGHNISLLGARGLNKTYLRELLGEGPDVAGPIAAALASATDAQLGQVNSAEFQISKTAGQLGKLGANLLFDSGPDVGKSFLSGLKGQEKQLKAFMRELAQVLVITIKTGLKLPGVSLPGTGGGVALHLVYDGPATGPVMAIMKDMRVVIADQSGGDVQKALGRGPARR